MLVKEGVKLKEKDIPNAEEELGKKIPVILKNFLLIHNGLALSFCSYDFYLDSVKEEVSFESFLGIHFINSNYDLIKINNKFLNELPSCEEILIIGRDSGGNFYLLNYGKETPGIYYWDRIRSHSYVGDNELENEQTVLNYEDEGQHIYVVTENSEMFFKQFKSFLIENNAEFKTIINYKEIENF